MREILTILVLPAAVVLRVACFVCSGLEGRARYRERYSPLAPVSLLHSSFSNGVPSVDSSCPELCSPYGLASPRAPKIFREALRRPGATPGAHCRSGSSDWGMSGPCTRRPTSCPS